MNSSVTPARILQIAGGLGMIIATFLQWATDILPVLDEEGTARAAERTFNGWDTGMLGLWQVIIGAVIVIAALAAMAKPESLPTELFGFRFEKALVVLAFPVLLWNFGLQFDDLHGGVGLLVGWIAAAITIAGSELQGDAFSSN